MSSIFADYNPINEVNVNDSNNGRPSASKAMKPSGAGGIEKEVDNVPFIDKQKIPFKPSSPLTHLTVSNDHLILCMTNNALLRLDLDKRDAPQDDVQLTTSKDDRVHALFLDPTGRHCIISLRSRDNLYLSRTSKKGARHLTKAKGHLIEAVAWNRANTSDTSTGEILLGTSDGGIYETSIVSQEEGRFFAATADAYFRLVFKVADRLTGLELDEVREVGGTSGGGGEQHFFVIATTPTRLYQFSGGVPQSAEQPIFQHIFEPYSNVPGGDPQFVELPAIECNVTTNLSHLRLYRSHFRSKPTALAWLVGPGVYHGRLNVTESANVLSRGLLYDANLIAFPKPEADDAASKQMPLSVELTEFHLVFLYPDRVKLVCILNEACLHVERLGALPQLGSERFLGLCTDTVQGGLMWCYTAQSVYKLRLIRPDRHIWRIYLERGDYDAALGYCGNNAQHRDKVIVAKANKLFDAGNHVAAAEEWARSLACFEEITLKLLNLPSSEPLRIFLEARLSHTEHAEPARVTVLVLWITELYLQELGLLRDAARENSKEFEQLQEGFQKLLAMKMVNPLLLQLKDALYELMSSHGDVNNMVYLACLVSDHDRTIGHYIRAEEWRTALTKLMQQPLTDLHYRYGPTLIRHLPAETVECWCSLGRKLKPCLLLPALLQAEPEYALRYLERVTAELHAIDQPLHNYLLTLYAKHKVEKLMPYLEKQGDKVDLVCYNPKYALRVCKDADRKQACVHLYTLLDLHEEAVELALQLNVEEAKTRADLAGAVEPELRKKLWLRIARHVVENERDVERAMRFLQEAGGVLKIEDILPFFPEFVTIDHFKDAICTSLDEYNSHINILQQQMKDATHSAQDIRSQMQQFRHRFATVRPQEVCHVCSLPLLRQTFVLFPCNHAFHTACLHKAVLPRLEKSQRLKFEQILQQTDTSSTRVSQIRDEFDEIIAADCILCGDPAIDDVDRPYIEPNVFLDVMDQWK